MKKYVLLKLSGLAILAMVTLIISSIIEVIIYSYLVNPGHESSVYETHAQFSAPFISGIFGFLVFFSVAAFWKRKGYENAFRLTLLFPAIYTLLDLCIIILLGANWSDFMLTFMLANGAKFLGSYSGYMLVKSNPKNVR